MLRAAGAEPEVQEPEAPVPAAPLAVPGVQAAAQVVAELVVSSPI